MEAIQALVRARMRLAMKTDEDREERSARVARSQAALARVIDEQIRDYRGRIARMEAEPDGAVRNASAIRFHQTWIDENTSPEDEPKLLADEGDPDHRSDAG